MTRTSSASRFSTTAALANEAATCYIPNGWGRRVSILAARSVTSGVKFSMLDNIEEGSDELEDFDDVIGVDAGMAGIFDDSVYGLDSAFKGWPEPVTQFSNLPGAKWFGHCCDALDNSDQAGIFPFGVVSHSGFGDGAYEGFYHTGEDGKIDLAAVVFCLRRRSIIPIAKALGFPRASFSAIF